MAEASAGSERAVSPPSGGVWISPWVLARNKGWPFVLAWAHRLSGLFLAAFFVWHLWTVSLLKSPAEFDAAMRAIQGPVFTFLEWLLGLPLILHALNGGRLILFEFYGFRNERNLTAWVLGLGGLYSLLTGWLMILGDQSATPVFFGLASLALALAGAFSLALRLSRSRHAWTWKWQRISAVFLLVMIPAHFLFAHLNLALSHQAAPILARLNLGAVRVVDGLMVLALVYHAGCGLASLAGDYLARTAARRAAAGLVMAIGLWAVWIGFKLTFSF